MNRRHLQLFFAFALLELPLHAQKPSPPKVPAQIELLETHIRFESNGDSRKEVHTRVHINDELGINQFARLNFDYNRAFQQIEIPSVHITHAGGGTADILPSAIADQPNPAVVGLPIYQDVRVKSVRILGLAPGDQLDYRVITTTTHHPLAPDFWLDHVFDRSGVVAREIFQLELPAQRKVQLRVPPEIPAASVSNVCEGQSCSIVRTWQLGGPAATEKTDKPSDQPDIVLTTFASSADLSMRLASLQSVTVENAAIEKKASELLDSAKTPAAKLEAIYDFVSQKIATVDLPLGSTGFRPSSPEQILSSGFATAEDKFALFAALVSASHAEISCSSALVRASDKTAVAPNSARPSLYAHELIWISAPKNLWLDPSLEVAPFGVIPSNLRGQTALILAPRRSGAANQFFPNEIHAALPFASFQKVAIDATLETSGNLAAKVRYTMRGDNELLLRIAFHQTPKDKWNEVAQLLSLSDGFRGQITKVNASDPYATHDPFTIEYEISQPQFVNWSKKPVRIPAILPLLGLPDPPASSSSEIQIGTPLDVDTHLTLHLPAGTTAQTPTGTTVDRDYATFSSHYSAQDGVISAARHINFLSRSLPATRAMDYNAFLHAVQSDESQLFTLSSPPVH